MGLVGQLADLGLDDIFKIIQLSRKSGCLTVQGYDQEWTVTFWHGDIVRLSSPRVLPALVAELQRRSLVDPETFDQALGLLAADSALHLGTILENRFGVPAEILACVSHEIAEGFLQELKGWEDGAFSFDLWEEGSALSPAAGSNHLTLYRGSEAAGRVPALPTLPDALHEPEGGEAAGIAEPADTIASRSTVPVWIVDDDPYLRQELGNYLRGQGMTVKLFESAADFWICLRKADLEGVRPMAVIDLIMPRLAGEGKFGGLELLEKICTAYPDMRVLALADRYHAELEHKVRELGIPDLFAKPRKSELRREFGRQSLLYLARTLLGSLHSVEAPLSGRLPGAAETKAMPRIKAKPSVRLRNSPGLHLLKGMLEELQNPTLGGGIILLVLRFASELMNRAVIFSVKEHNFVGIGQFGVVLEDGETDVAIRNIVIPRDADSVLGPILTTPRCMHARMGKGQWDRALCRALGGVVPDEVFLGPIVSEGRVVAVLYGDNLPERRIVGDTEALEIFLSQAGLAMEKALLEGKLLEARSG